MSAIWNGMQELIGATLSFFYGLIANFGIAIILLTIVIGILLFPPDPQADPLDEGDAGHPA